MHFESVVLRGRTLRLKAAKHRISCTPNSQELDSKSSLKSNGSGKRPPAKLTKKTEHDADELKEKLLEREKKAEENRIKQLENKKAAAAKKEQYADQVRERAKTRIDGEEDDEDVEYGGEGNENEED